MIAYTCKPTISAAENINGIFITQINCNTYSENLMWVPGEKKSCGDKNKIKDKWFQNFVCF